MPHAVRRTARAALILAVVLAAVPAGAASAAAPAAPALDSTPADPSFSDDPSFAFTPAEPGGTLECSLDSPSVFATCESRTSQAYEDVAEGAHTFRVRQVGAGGDEGAVAAYTWTVDLTAPGRPAITGGPAQATASRDASFTFEAAEPGGLVECSLDASSYASFSACDSPGAQSYGGLGDGEHVFRVRQIDDAGNAGEMATYTWTVGASAPATGDVLSAPIAGPGPGRLPLAGDDGGAVQAGAAASGSATPRILRLTAGPRCGLASRRARRAARSTSLTLRLTLSSAATIRIAVDRRRSPLRRGSCVRAAAGSRSRATRLRLSRRGRPGRNVVRVAATGRLRPGAYRVLVIAVSASGERSAAATAILRVARR